MSTNAIVPTVNEPVQQQPQQVIPPPPPEGTPMPPPRPRDDGGRFVAQQPASNTTQQPPAPVQSSTQQVPNQPYTLTDKGNGTWEIVYATGERFTGSTSDVLSATANAHVNTKRWAQGIRDQYQQPQQPQQPQVQPQPTQAELEQKAADDFIVGAVARRMGFKDADEMIASLGQIQTTANNFEAQSLAASFAASCPDFNATQDNIEKLFGVLQESGFSEDNVTPQALRMAHVYCVNQKIYDARPTQQPQQPQFQGNVPPPMIQSSAPNAANMGTIPPPSLNMSAQELRDNFERAKAAGLV